MRSGDPRSGVRGLHAATPWAVATTPARPAMESGEQRPHMGIGGARRGGLRRLHSVTPCIAAPHWAPAAVDWRPYGEPIASGDAMRSRDPCCGPRRLHAAIAWVAPPPRVEGTPPAPAALRRSNLIDGGPHLGGLAHPTGSAVSIVGPASASAVKSPGRLHAAASWRARPPHRKTRRIWAGRGAHTHTHTHTLALVRVMASFASVQRSKEVSF